MSTLKPTKKCSKLAAQVTRPDKLLCVSFWRSTMKFGPQSTSKKHNNKMVRNFRDYKDLVHFAGNFKNFADLDSDDTPSIPETDSINISLSDIFNAQKISECI